MAATMATACYILPRSLVGVYQHFWRSLMPLLSSSTQKIKEGSSSKIPACGFTAQNRADIMLLVSYKKTQQSAGILYFPILQCPPSTPIPSPHKLFCSL
jgi:hypothetical protein